MTTDRPTVRVQRLDPRATLPQRHSEHAAGLDLAACLPRGDYRAERVTIEPGTIARIPTGLILAIPHGYEGQVRPRSGLSTKHGITLPNSPGTIDSDYRGEAFVALINLGKEPFVVEQGMRIAQLVVAPVTMPEVEVAEELDTTARGSGGFGSTGF